MDKPVHHVRYPCNSSKSNVPYRLWNDGTDIFERVSAIMDSTHIEVDLSDTCDAQSRANKITRAIEERGLYRKGLLYSGRDYQLKKEDYLITGDDLAYGWIQNIEDEGKNRDGRLYKLLIAFPERNLNYGLGDNPNPLVNINPIARNKIIYVLDPSKLKKSRIDEDVYFILDDRYVVATVEIK